MHVLVKVVAAMASLVAGMGGGLPGAVPAGAEPASPDPRAGAVTLRVYHTNPTLVRAGERVLMPVDVVCAVRGRPCAAEVTLGVRTAGDSWRTVTAPASPVLAFDLSAPAARGVAGSASGSVEFFVRAEGPGGIAESNGAPQPGRSLRFHVAREIPTVALPEIPFGEVRQGAVELFLPWGTGPMRAGLVPGNESATVGPSAFDVDDAGRIHLADGLQGRLATFEAGRLVRQVELSMSPDALVAAGPGGVVHVADRSEGTVTVRTVAADGRASEIRSVGGGLPSELLRGEGGAFLRVLPLDAIVPIVAPGAAVLAGLPSSAGQVVRIARESSVRLGVVDGGAVRQAIEVTSSKRLGEVPLAVTDGSGALVAVVRVARDVPSPADQFQVLRIADGRIVSGFAVASDAFTDMGPMARFRLGGDGHLYQLKTFSDGVRVVRFDLGEDR